MRQLKKYPFGIAVDKAAFDPGERESITQLVAFAAGVSPESISVQNFQFVKAQDTATADTAQSGGINKMVLYSGIGGGFLLLVIGLLVFLMLKKRRKKAMAEGAAKGKGTEPGDGQDKEDALNNLFGEVDSEEVRHITPVQDTRREEIKDFAKSNPEIVAQMIKSWLRSEGDE